MAESVFKHLESIPLDEENLVIRNNPTNNIKSKACLNLGFIASNSLDRFSNILLNNTSVLNDIDINTFLGISYILENQLIYLLNTTCISNLQNTEITEHYRRRQINISSGKILPSFKYCQDLLYSNFKVWGGLYGTVQYYMNLIEEYKEYYTPSELTYYSVNMLLKMSSNISYQEYLNTNYEDYNLSSLSFKQLISFIENSEEEADFNIYNSCKVLLTQPSKLNNVLTNLRFFENWLPKVYTWYLSTIETEQSLPIIANSLNNKQRARNTLIKVFNAISSKALDELSFKNLYSNFVRQNINVAIYDVIDELIVLRKESTYIEINTVSESVEELLTKEFHQAISIINNSIDYRASSNLILSSYTPPGGYCLLQVSVALTLINRAYTLAYLNRRNNNLVQNTLLYKRLVKLIGLASILLIKTNKKHIQAQGINLLKTFNINLENIQPNNLLDL